MTIAQPRAPLTQRQLVIARAGLIAMSALLIALFIVIEWFLYAELQQPCGVGCFDDGFYLTPSDIITLKARGFSTSFYAAYQVGLYVIFFLVFGTVAALIMWRSPKNRMAVFVGYALMLWGAMFPSAPRTLVQAAPALGFLIEALIQIAGICFYLFFFIAPNGQFSPRWTRWVWLLMTSYFLLRIALDHTAIGPRLQRIQPIVFIFVLATAVGSQIYRYRRVSDAIERQQSKWVFYGIVLGLGEILIFIMYVTLIDPSMLQGPFSKMLTNTMIYIGFLIIPLSIGMAILRARLWDIDILISRTLVYAALTICDVGIYVFVVGYLGSLLHTSGHFAISLVATGLIAVLFQPLRGWLQRGANRLLYGERDEPYTVVARLGQRLEATLAPSTVLPTIVETVAQALKLPYAAIVLKQSDVFRLVAAYGQPHDDLLRLPLTYGAATVGQLLLAPRVPGERFAPADYDLLAVLAQQAGVAAHAVHLTLELQELNADLQHAREQLVTAREEERRRLRRDLHDGIAPTLASLAQRLDAAAALVHNNPEQANAMLIEIKAQVRATVAEIRRLVYALRPPVLDEFGLAAAIREHAERISRPDTFQVALDVPERFPALPAAIEVAAYRIVLEALTNVTRQGNAHSCWVRVALIGSGERQTLCLEIEDDGTGAPGQADINIASMQERAAELGGLCTMQTEPSAGTRISAWLPLPQTIEAA